MNLYLYVNQNVFFLVTFRVLPCSVPLCFLVSHLSFITCSVLFYFESYFKTAPLGRFEICFFVMFIYNTNFYVASHNHLSVPTSSDKTTTKNSDVVAHSQKKDLILRILAHNVWLMGANFRGELNQTFCRNGKPKMGSDPSSDNSKWIHLFIR